MDFKKEKKVYDLEYIQNIFTVTPLAFIFILSVISIMITYVILEAKQNRQIDLIYQKKVLKNEFNKKEILIDFSSKINQRVDEELSQINKVLQEHTYKIIGSLDNNHKELKLDTTVEFLEKYENDNEIDIVLFERGESNIIYGHDKLRFLSQLIFGKYNLPYKEIVLKYIYSQGRYNLQEWKNNLTGELRLSFFDLLVIDGKEYFVGSFSKQVNIRNITKSMIIDGIDRLNKTDDYSIWLFDMISKQTYNFNNEQKFHYTNELLLKDQRAFKYNILKHFNSNEEFHKSFDSHILYNNKYKYLVAIDYKNDEIIDNKDIIKKYNALFLNITFYIVVIGIILIIASFLFSKFIKNILDNYNKKLQERTDSLTHWKNRFQLAVIASNDGLWDIDFETEEIYFSKKWLEISGYKDGEVKKFSDWFALIHKNDKVQVENIFEEIFANKRDSFVCEYRLKTKNEGFKWMLGRGRLFIDTETGHKRMLMMSMDIDKNKRMKKELLDVELLVEDGKIVIFKLFNDEKMSVKYISNAIKNYGYTKEIFENGEMNFLDLIHKEDIKIVKVALNAALTQDLKDFTFVCRASNAANDIRWISCRTLVLKDHSGNIVNFYGYINDITKIKLSEQELKDRVEKELKKNRQKDRIMIQQSKLAAMGEMLGNIAHQWRQPLNNVGLYLQFLKDNYKNENSNEELVNKYFDKSFSQITYMSQTIDDFRNFYKPSKQKIKFNVEHAIDSTLEIIKAQLKIQDIKLIKDIQDIELISFENELQQSILNVLSNAMDAIKQKRETIKFEAYISIDVKVNEEFVNIDIQNNGGQIDEDIISRIFEPYFTTKFEAQGTGIGLYMTKSIIETNMKGKLEVCNTDDGVLFMIKLPLNKEEA